MKHIGPGITLSFIVIGAVLIVTSFIPACLRAKATTPVQIEQVIGPGGEACLIFVQDGKAFAGECK